MTEIETKQRIDASANRQTIFGSAPGHYLNQCWLIVNYTSTSKFQWNFDQFQTFSFRKIELEYGVCNMTTTLFRLRCVSWWMAHQVRGNRHGHGDVIKWKHFPRYCPLCGEFTGHRWIPLTKVSNTELWCFLWSAPWINGWVNNREAGDLRRHRVHYDAILMIRGYLLNSLGLALLTLSWDKNWDNHSLVNGYPSFYPRIALVAPSPGGANEHPHLGNMLTPSNIKGIQLV